MNGVDPVEILVVDDNPNNLGSLEALLGNLSARVIKAHSGEEALRQLLDHHDVAVILLDIQMPGLDGFETAQLIRGRERTRHVPIIFITAHSSDDATVLRGYSLGAVDFLFKPIVADILKAKVSVFLDLSRKTLQLARLASLRRQAAQRDHELALAESRREFERQRQHRVAEALAVLSDAANELLVGVLDGALVERLAARLATHLGLEVFMEHRIDASKTRLQMASATGLSLEGRGTFSELPLGEGAPGIAAQSKRSVVLSDLHASPRDVSGHLDRLSAIACFPLVAGGNVLGTLSFGTRRPARTMSGDDVKMMQAFCDQVGAALERDQLLTELKERDQRKDEFLAMLSHELRNPLAPVRTAIELVRAADVPPAMVQRALASADRQVTHMIRMLDDLLDVTRITRGKVELRRAPVSLASVVEQAVETTEAFLKSRRHKLKVTLPAEPVVLNVDATRLVQVLSNLLHNAAKYTDKDGNIDLVATLSGDGAVVVRVSDDGIGIRPELLPRVFDLFVQGEVTIDRAQGGLGIGLTMVRRLLEMHGGSVAARSAGLGRGSEFTVRLPLSAADVAPDDAASDVVLPDVPPLHVLLVEDNADVREMMRDLLEFHGHRVDEACDGIQGIEMLVAKKPQVALIDIGLPGLDGYGLAERVRATASSTGVQTRLIAMTGYGRPEERDRALRAGFDGHIVKPVSMHEISTLFRKLF